MATNKAQSNQNNHNLLSRFMPMVHWAPNYERSWLRFDLIAGITVAACG